MDSKLTHYHRQRRYLLLIFVVVMATYTFYIQFAFEYPPRSINRNEPEERQNLPALPTSPYHRSENQSRTSGSITIPFVEEDNWMKLGLEQSDPRLVEIVKRKLLISPPPPMTLQKQNWSNNTIFINEQGNNDRFEWVDKVLGPGPGFFIECGAHDGVYLSNTLRLEKTRKWTGLLIEPHPTSFQLLLKNKRNAWILNVALCLTPIASQVSFWIYVGKGSKAPALSSLNREIIEKWPYRKDFTKITVPCVPLYTILKAMNVSTVDYLSLDVEGSELGVLATLPFDKLQFKAMGIENTHMPGKRKALRSFLEDKDYRYATDIEFDSLFVHKSIPLPATSTSS